MAGCRQRLKILTLMSEIVYALESNSDVFLKADYYLMQWRHVSESCFLQQQQRNTKVFQMQQGLGSHASSTDKAKVLSQSSGAHQGYWPEDASPGHAESGKSHSPCRSRHIFRTSGTIPCNSMVGYCSLRFRTTRGVLSGPRKRRHASMHCMRLATEERPHSFLKDTTAFCPVGRRRSVMSQGLRVSQGCCTDAPGYPGAAWRAVSVSVTTDVVNDYFILGKKGYFPK